MLGGYLTLSRDMYELLNEYGNDPSAIGQWVVDTRGLESELQQSVREEGFFFLSKRAAFCHEDDCEILDANNVPFTYDTHHLSFPFASRIAQGQKAEIDEYLGSAADAKDQAPDSQTNQSH